MLRIRFSRMGRVGQPSFRIVLAEHRSPVKGRYIEMLGHYLPALQQKVTSGRGEEETAEQSTRLSLHKDRITYWISKGAIPSDSVASLLKKEGIPDMERYMEPRNKQRKKRKTAEEAPGAKEKSAPPPAAAPPAVS